MRTEEKDKLWTVCNSNIRNLSSRDATKIKSPLQEISGDNTFKRKTEKITRNKVVVRHNDWHTTDNKS